MASKPFLLGGTIFLLVSILALATALVDSKYWVIYYVSKFEKPDPVAYFSALWSVQAAVAALVYPIVIALGNTTLCRVEGGTTLSWFEWLLIRLSFDFGASNEGVVELTVNDILKDAQAEAIVSLRSGEPEAFEENVKSMFVLYESILDASQVRDVSGGNASLMLVADRNHWFERPVYEVWSRRFIDLFEAASSKLSLGEDYVSFLTHVPNRLFSSAQEKAVRKSSSTLSR